jgi:hypothetical protein
MSQAEKPSTTILSRRTALAAISAAIAATPTAVPAQDADPIFAAMEEHQKVFRVWDAALTATSKLEGEWFARRKNPFEKPGPALSDAREQDAICSCRECDAADAMIETTPTTLAGLLGVIRYVLSHYDRGHELLSDEQLLTFIGTIGDAIEAIGVAP